MKKNYFLTFLCVTFLSLVNSGNVFGQSGNSHDPTLELSYTPAGYTAATTMRQDNGYTTFSKSNVNNNGGGTDLFVNFTFDTSGKSVYISYTTDGSPPGQETGTSTTVVAGFNNYTEPNRTWLGTIPTQTAGTTVNYVFYASDGTIGAAWARFSATGYTNTLGDAYTAYSYTVKDSNLAGGGDWSSTGTWNSGSVPNSASTSVEIIGTNAVSLNQNTDVLDLDLISGSILNLSATKGVTVNGNLTNNGTLSASAGSSLIVTGASSGNITYNRNLGTTNWYMVSSPVTGQGIVDFYTTESPALGSGTGNAQNVAIAPYDNSQALAADRWNYYTEGQVDGADGDDTTDTFTSGTGYTVKLGASSDIVFTGTMPVDNFTTLSLTDNSLGSGNAFNLMGNPYPSYIASDETANATNNILAINTSLLTEETIWIWDQSLSGGTGAYTQYNNTSGLHIAPGQAFFVSANGASSTFAINENMQSHQGTDNFQRTETTRPEINLVMTDGSITRDADIFYIDGTTTGFDNGYDSSIFGGVSHSFAVFTETIANGNGKRLGIQSLPNSDLESMVIPVGVIADAVEITFSAVALNLPTGIKVFLEDRTTNTFTRLDEANSEYKITLSEALNGIGRFYLHTKASVLALNDVTLENVSIYKTNNSTLRVVGLSQGKTNVKLFNILGKQVLNTSFKSNGVSEISLPKLATGVYIVQLENKAGKLNKKIVLE